MLSSAFSFPLVGLLLAATAALAAPAAGADAGGLHHSSPRAGVCDYVTEAGTYCTEDDIVWSCSGPGAVPVQQQVCTPGAEACVQLGGGYAYCAPLPN